MANPFRQQARLRKLTYFGLILVLFTLSLFLRRFFIEPQALALQLSEQSRGEVELTSSAVRLLLIGSRGLATCGLWWTAQEKQKRQQWNELELVTRTITKLQPHFITPWRFLGWNLAFNVSVECDLTRDKYFYVSRGLFLLAEGERRNRGLAEAGLASERLRFPGNPDLRQDIGFFYQLKIGASDEKHYMRCLLDLSCIDPLQREPARFWGVDARGRRIVKQVELEDFCRRYPRLVRRLREHMGRSRPADIVAFLEDNKEVPSRFEAPSAAAGLPETPLKPIYEQFPILPAPQPLPADMPDVRAREFPFSFDVYRAAHAWYLYAQEPLPPPDPDEAIRETPVDPFRYRLPRMATVIFRSYPARALFYWAEEMEKEGWFDKDQGWTIRDWFEQRPGSGARREVTVGTEAKYHTRPAWETAHRAYYDFALQNGLYFPLPELLKLQAQAQRYQHWQQQHVAEEEIELARHPELRPAWEAYKRLQRRDADSMLTNVQEFLMQSAVEQLPQTIQARKLFFAARDLEARAFRSQAVRAYETALNLWEELLLGYSGFRRISNVQIETYENQARYLSLRQQYEAPYLRPLVLGLARLGQPRPGLSPALLEELDPAWADALLPLRRVQGRFDLLYVLDMPETVPLVLAAPVPEVLSLEDVLAVLTHAPGWTPLGISPYERNHLLTVWRLTPLPQAPLSAKVAWRPLLNDPAVEQLRRQKRLEERPQGAEQPPPLEAAVPANAP